MYKGPYNARTATPLTTVLYHTKNNRDNVLKTLTDGNHTCTFNGTNLRTSKTKTKLQLQRNYALKKAKDLLTDDPATRTKTVTLNWKLDNTTDRKVTVNGTPAFTQTKDDPVGTFHAPFLTLTIPLR